MTTLAQDLKIGVGMVSFAVFLAFLILWQIRLNPLAEKQGEAPCRTLCSLHNATYMAVDYARPWTCKCYSFPNTTQPPTFKEYALEDTP